MRSEPLNPILQLATALMTKKSHFYMGLQPDQFIRLLQLTQQKVLSDVKLMLALTEQQRNNITTSRSKLHIEPIRTA